MVSLFGRGFDSLQLHILQEPVSKLLMGFFHGQRPLQNLTPSSIILVFEHYWLTRSQYF